MKLRLDFVTNSSSSCFVCKTDKSIGEIRFQLQVMLDTYNLTTGKTLAFEDVFEEPFISDNPEAINESATGHYWSYDKKELKEMQNKVLIYSASDNTIPYSLWELIEEAFDAIRKHLG